MYVCMYLRLIENFEQFYIELVNVVVITFVFNGFVQNIPLPPPCILAYLFRVWAIIHRIIQFLGYGGKVQ